MDPTGNMGAVSEMMDDDQRDDGQPAGEAGRKRGGKEGKICSHLEVGSRPKFEHGSDLKGIFFEHEFAQLANYLISIGVDAEF